MIIGSNLTSQAKSWSRRSRRVGLYRIALFVQETTQDPSCLAFFKVAILVSLYGLDPSAGHVATTLMFSHVDNLIDMILFLPRLEFSNLCFVELLGKLSQL